MELTDPTGQLLTEIGQTEMKQRDVAQTYHLAMKSSVPTRWPEVNAAIIRRWSKGGLEQIKSMAHSGTCFR
jgi:hypothetical protein